MKWEGVVGDGVLQMVMLVIGGIITGIIHGRGKKSAKTA